MYSEFGDYPSPELLEMEKCRPYAPYWDADVRNAYYHGTYGLQQCNRIPGRRPSCVTGTASMTAEFVLSELQSVGSPEKAAHLSRFFKTGPGQYGEGDRFLGVVVPQTRSIAKANKAMPLDELQRLLIVPGMRPAFVPCWFWSISSQDKRRRKLNGKKMYRFYLKNTRRCNNWDLVDLSCRDIVGEYLVNQDRSVLYELAASDNL